MNEIAEIRRLYLREQARHDSARFRSPIDLLKALKTEEERSKAVVYMEGLAQLRKEWGRKGR